MDHSLGSQGKLPEEYLSNNKEYLSQVNSGVIQVMGRKSVALRRNRASLVVQWLRVRLPMQGTQVRAPVREDPTCRRATKPVSHNY